MKSFPTVSACVAACIMAATSTAWAHRPSESYLTLKPGASEIDARLDLALRDVDWALRIDADGNGLLTWAEVIARKPDIETYVLSRFSVRTAQGACPANIGTPQLRALSDGPYLSLPISLGCRVHGESLALSYGLFFDVDPQHRALIRLDDGTDKTIVLSKESAQAQIALGSTKPASALAVTASFVRHGADHIAAGFDHLLFLLLLLLPAVLRREGGQWVPMPKFKTTFVEVTKVVTAFTAAHAITMSAAALGLVSVPSTLIEPAIALSLVIAAANNVWPIFAGGRWALPFSLGLLHGFGFSSALADLNLPISRIVPALFGFNLGVELGQLALVALVVPLAFLFRRSLGYRRVAITGGSFAIAAIALFWFVERVFNISS